MHVIRAVTICRFYSTSRFWKIIDFILLASTNRQNTGSAAFHRQESIKHIIRLFSKAACVTVHTAGRNEEHADEEILQNNNL